nr:hypothetical protein [Nonomuraea gerenzanensis]
MMAGNLRAVAEQGPALIHASNLHLQRNKTSMSLGDRTLEWWSAGAIAGAHVGGGTPSRPRPSARSATMSRPRTPLGACRPRSPGIAPSSTPAASPRLSRSPPPAHLRRLRLLPAGTGPARRDRRHRLPQGGRQAEEAGLTGVPAHPPRTGDGNPGDGVRPWRHGHHRGVGRRARVRR